MQSFFDRIAHLPTTLEGTVWGVAVVALVHYLMTTGHCDFSQVDWVKWVLGAIPVVRGALAKGPTVASAGAAPVIASK